tara:strand:- start:293 stop:556 length:264 start_codon:yes stop_codon:yes gene_type:complete
MWKGFNMKYTKYTIVNEIIMQIVGLFAKLDAENQMLIVKTLQQTITRNRKPGDLNFESTEMQEQELLKQQEHMQLLGELEEIQDILK